MNTRSGMQLVMMELLLFGCFLAATLLLLQKNKKRNAVPVLVSVMAFLFLCAGAVLYLVSVLTQSVQGTLLALVVLLGVGGAVGLGWFLSTHWRQVNGGGAALFFTYLAAVLFITLWSRKSGSNTSYRADLLTDLVRAIKNHDMDPVRHLMQNIALFVPIGALLPTLHRKLRSGALALLCGLSLSAGIETVQLLAARGQCDLNDILANTLGAVLGYGLFRLFSRSME